MRDNHNVMNVSLEPPTKFSPNTVCSYHPNLHVMLSMYYPGDSNIRIVIYEYTVYRKAT